MAAIRQNFEMHQGDDVSVAFSVTDDAGAVVDLTGTTVVWRMAPSKYSASPSISKSTASGITVTDAVGGKFTVAIDAADTAGLGGIYYHEAQVTDAGGKVTTVATGWLTVTRELIP